MMEVYLSILVDHKHLRASGELVDFLSLNEEDFNKAKAEKIKEIIIPTADKILSDMDNTFNFDKDVFLSEEINTDSIDSEQEFNTKVSIDILSKNQILESQAESISLKIGAKFKEISSLFKELSTICININENNSRLPKHWMPEATDLSNNLYSKFSESFDKFSLNLEVEAQNFCNNLSPIFNLGELEFKGINRLTGIAQSYHTSYLKQKGELESRKSKSFSSSNIEEWGIDDWDSIPVDKATLLGSQLIAFEYMFPEVSNSTN